jgi:hypothetical protein
MPVLIILELGLQMLCAAHVVRTHRPYYWIFIILAFPLLGSIAYAVAEILPEFLHSKQARNVVKLIDPDRDYRTLVEQLDTADTADNRRALAEECLRRGEAERAVLLYEASLTGAHKDDPTLMFGLARALFAPRRVRGLQQDSGVAQGRQPALRFGRRPPALRPQPGVPESGGGSQERV